MMPPDGIGAGTPHVCVQVARVRGGPPPAASGLAGLQAYVVGAQLGLEHVEIAAEERLEVLEGPVLLIEGRALDLQHRAAAADLQEPGVPGRAGDRLPLLARAR